MNWEHLRAFLWLQWRLRSHQMKRAGIVSVIISAIVTVGMFIAGIGAFFGGIAAGRYALRGVSSDVLMLVWDGIIAGFLFVWMIGLLAELQRSEMLSMDRFLHLPVSLNSVFLINYIGTIVCPTTVVFIPGMIGLSIGLVWSRGPMMLMLFPIVLGFVLLVTALTHQFQGWLAALMVDKRRRRTVIAFATMFFVVLVQTPNLLRFATSSGSGQSATNADMRKELQAVDRERAAGQVTPEQAQEKSESIRARYREKRQEQRNEQFSSVQRIASLANAVIPFGWLAYGAKAVADGKTSTALLAALGLAVIGAGSLYRSYHTTLRLYTGDFTTARKRRRAVAVPVAKPIEDRAKTAARPTFLEKDLPYLSEQASAIALACFRSITRAPEAKMLLLTPIILVVVFGSMVGRGGGEPSEFVRPLYASGAIVMILFSLIQLAGNQFGFDRSGFRTFILSPASRREILLGKNVSLAPLALGMGLIATMAVQIRYPMGAAHFLGVIAQMITMYLLFCLVANLLSILAPAPIAAGSLRPAGPKGVLVLIHIAFTFLFPLALTPSLIPLGVEFLLSWFGWTTWLPVYLLLTILEASIVLYLYPRLLNWQASLFYEREQRILETVTAKVQ